MAAHHGGLLNEADIQAWLNEKSPADLVNALYQMLEPVADQLCSPAVPITTPAPDMFTESMQRPQIHAWPKTAISSRHTSRPDATAARRRTATEAAARRF